MKDLFEKFDLFLRYYVCGSVFIITAWFASGNLKSIAGFLDKEIFFIIPLIPGALIYGLHRNLINPLIDRIRIKSLSNKKFKRTRYLSDEEWNYIEFRWECKKNTTKGILHINKWGDHVQMLYTTALAILLGSALSWLFASKRNGYGWNWNLFLLWILFALAGLFSDVRKQLAEEKLMEEPPRYKACCIRTLLKLCFCRRKRNRDRRAH